MTEPQRNHNELAHLMQQNESLSTDEIEVSLWLLETSQSTLIPIYALNEQDASLFVDKWLARQEDGIRSVALTPFPRGFTLYRSVIPGKRKIARAEYEQKKEG